MKIVIFAETYYPDVMGGGEFSTKQMAEGLAERGHEVVVYCLGTEVAKEDIRGVCVKRKYLKGLSEHFMSLCRNTTVADPFTRLSKISRKWGDLYPDRKWYETYRSLITKEKPDLVHTAAPMSYLGRANLWRAAYDLKIPVSHVARGPLLLEIGFLGGRLDAWNKRRNAKASSCLTALAAPSSYMLNAHLKAGINGRRFNDVIYNSAGPVPEEITEDFIKQKENMILYAGEISSKKGISTLCDAVAGLDGLRTVLIGSGPLAEDIRREGRAEVLGWMEQEDLFSYMKKAKAVVLPSVWNEPFGRILTEAVNCGTIAIGSDRGGIPEVLAHDEDYIFKSGDLAGLRHRIKRVTELTSSGYMEEIEKQRSFSCNYTDEAYKEKWEKFFLQQLG